MTEEQYKSLKPGDKVRSQINCYPIEAGKIYTVSSGFSGVLIEVGLDGVCGCWESWDYLGEKTLETLEVGGEVDVGNDAFKRVLTKPSSGEGDYKCYGLSQTNNPKVYDGVYTVYEMKKHKWKPKNTTPVEERSVDDVLASLSEEDKEILKKAMK